MAASKGNPKRIAQLRSEALEATMGGKHKRVLELNLELAREDPLEPTYPQRAGDAARKIGDAEVAIAQYSIAAEAYSRQGFLIKAVALCKTILDLDPKHTATQEKLAKLNAASPQRKYQRSPSAIIDSGRSAVTPGDVAATEATSGPTPLARLDLQQVRVLAASVGGGNMRDAAPIREKVSPRAAWAHQGAFRELDSTRSADAVRGNLIANQPSSQSIGERRPRRTTIPPGRGLDAVNLANLVAGSRNAVDLAPQGGIVEIALGDDEQIDDLFAEWEVDVRTPVDRTANQAEVIAQATAEATLPKTPLFSALGRDSLANLITRCALLDLEPGAVVVRQGEVSDRLYVVASGELAATRETGLGSTVVSRLGEGSFFGEVSILTDQPRSTTVTAVTPTQLLAIDREVIGDLIEDHPRVLRVMVEFVRSNFVQDLIAHAPMFASIPPQDRSAVVDRFRFVEVDADQALLLEGQKSPGIFVLLCGLVEVVRHVAGKLQTVATLQPGDVAGEMSILSNEPAVATVKTSSKCYMLALGRIDFQELITSYPQILIFVSDLADERQRRNAAADRAGAPVDDLHLELI